MIFGKGTLTFDNSSNMMTDGTNFYHIFSWYLRHKIKKGKTIRHDVQGSWMIIGTWIIIFWKNNG